LVFNFFFLKVQTVLGASNCNFLLFSRITYFVNMSIERVVHDVNFGFRRGGISKSSALRLAEDCLALLRWLAAVRDLTFLSVLASCVSEQHAWV